MEDNSLRKDSSRRDLLRYAGLAGFVGFIGFNGLKFSSKPAVAAPTGTPKIVDGTFAGEHRVSSYDIEYQNLNTSSDIEITYIFTDSTSTESTSTHSVSLSGEPASGTVSTESHNVTIPSGDIRLKIELSHPSLSSKISTSPSSVTTVYPDIIDASGGTTVTTFTDSNGRKYRIHAFENVGNDTFTVKTAPPDETIDVLVVGGGGGGGGDRGGGGGGGEVYFEANKTAYEKDYSVIVGGGGSGGTNDFGSNGGNSSFESLGVRGGGTGSPQYNSNAGKSGGSGGGGGCDGDTNGGNANPIIGFGNDGGDGKNNYSNVGSAAGGGGAGSEGVSPDGTSGELFRSPNGGKGKNYTEIFTSQFGLNGNFGGGGGGGTEGHTGATNKTNFKRVKGFDGGGDAGLIEYSNSVPVRSSNYNQEDGEDGRVNTGGGGGGGGYSDTRPTTGGDGGSGIVLIRYEI